MKIEMGIGWVEDSSGKLRSASPGEYAREIERLQGKCSQVDRYIALLNDAIADNEPLRDEIERLRGLLAWHDSTVHEILADNTRLRAVLHQLVSEGKISPNIARELLGWVTIEASP